MLVPPFAVLLAETLLFPLTLPDDSILIPLSPVLAIVKSPLEKTVPFTLSPFTPLFVRSVVVPSFETEPFMLKAPLLLIIFNVASLFVIVPSTIKFEPSFVNVASPVWVNDPFTYKSPALFITSAVLSLTDLPRIFNPCAPLFSNWISFLE